jgi:hypothetical protein
VLWDCHSDRQFLAVAAIRLAHLFPERPKLSGFHQRVRTLTPRIGQALSMLAAEVAAVSGQLQST